MLFVAIVAVSAFLLRSGHATDPSVHDRSQSPEEHYYPHYTALGDSYASGAADDLSRIQDDSVGACRRSMFSYPYLFTETFGDEFRIGTFNFPACSGADTEAVDRQIESGGSGDQEFPDIGYDFGDPDLVSISVGANTGHMFSNTLEACVLALFDNDRQSSNYYKPCEVALYNDYVTIYGLGESLPTLFEKAAKRNLIQGKAREVYVFGYPKFYARHQGYEHCPHEAVLPTPTLDGIAKELNSIVHSLNGALKTAADKTGAYFVDIDEKFHGHRICDQDTWFQTNYRDGADIFHPTERGYQAMIEAFKHTILEVRD